MSDIDTATPGGEFAREAVVARTSAMEPVLHGHRVHTRAQIHLSCRPADTVPGHGVDDNLVDIVAVIAGAGLAVEQVLSATSHVAVDVGVPASGDDTPRSASHAVGTGASVVVAVVLPVDFDAQVFPPPPFAGVVLVEMTAYA